MQDERLYQKSGDRFPFIEMPEDRVQGKNDPKSRFEIKIDSEESRRKAIFDFETEKKKPEESVSIVPEKQSAKTSADLASLIANAEKLIHHSEKELAKALIYKALSIDSKNLAALNLAQKVLNPVQDLSSILKIRKVICEVNYCFESIYQLADVYYRLGDDQNAKEKYLEALGLILDENQNVFEIYKNLGNILTREGDYEGAEEYYHRAYTLNPDSDSLLVNLGTLEFQLKEYNEALERFRRAIEINRQNEKAWVGLALVHHQMGDHDLAMANLENAIDLNPRNRTAVHIYANWCHQNGRYLQAADVVQKYLASVEQDEEMSLVLIQLLCQINRFDVARFEMEKVLLWNPGNEKFRNIEKDLIAMTRGK